MSWQERKARWRLYANSFLLTALAFWLPDALVHRLAGADFGGPEALLLTALLPATGIAANLGVLRLTQPAVSPKRWALAGVLGVWVTGGALMTFWNSPRQVSLCQYAVLLAVPPMTFMMAAYDGSLLALLIITVALTVVGRKMSQARDSAPPKRPF